MKKSNRWLVFLVAIVLFTLYIVLYDIFIEGHFSWVRLVGSLEFGLLASGFVKYESWRSFIGENTDLKRSKVRYYVYFFGLLFILTTFAITVGLAELNQLLSDSENKTTISLAQFSILAIAPVLGGLVLTASGNYKEQEKNYIPLLAVAKKLIAATILFLICIPCFYMISLLHGINAESIDWAFLLHSDSLWRGVMYWVGVPCFFGALILFWWGILDLGATMAGLEGKVTKETSELKEIKRNSRRLFSRLNKGIITTRKQENKEG